MKNPVMQDGLLVEFVAPEPLLDAVRHLRALGHRRLEALSPFEVPGLAEALELPPSRLPRATFCAAVCGLIGAYTIQWWCNAIDYPLRVGAFPLHSAPAFIPITFETTILFGSLCAFIGGLAGSGLPLLWHPLLEVEGTQRATRDRFLLAIDARDPAFTSAEALRHELEPFAPAAIRTVGAPP